MEIMDKALIEATDNFSKAGYPRDAELLLIVEVDGTESEVDILLKDVSSICKKNNCSSLKLSQSEKRKIIIFGQEENQHFLLVVPWPRTTIVWMVLFQEES